MAFWLASPVTDPAMLALTAGALGLGFAAAKTLAAMIASLSATWPSVKCGSPRHRRLHTNTIAVQGADAKMTQPAM